MTIETSPEWVDIHVHVEGLAPFGVDPAAYGAGQGVGVLVDAGSAPPAELVSRLDAVNARTETTVLAWANICAEGIAGSGCRDHDTSGCAAHAALRAAPGRVVGVKLQASSTRLGDRGLGAIATAIEVAEAFSVPLMVHVGNGPPTTREVVKALRAGDIVTHFAHGKPGGAVEGGRVASEFLQARERGVLFDVGHGAGSFSFEVMEALGREGLWPDTISTDLHRGSAEHPVGSLAECMSKLLCLGMAQDAVLAAVTSTPRAALLLPPASRRTRYEIRDEPWLATDSYGKQRMLAHRVVPLGLEANGG